jgi:nitroreductase
MAYTSHLKNPGTLIMQSIMEFHEVVKTRRSVRTFKPDEPDPEALFRVLEAARLSPSGSNRQPWRFVLVKDPDKKRVVVEACGRHTWIAEAPIVVVACGNKIGYNRGGYMGEMSFIMDVSIAFTQFILAARAEELGTCWIGDFTNDPIKEALGVPEDYEVVAVSPLGYPKSDKAFHETDLRKPLSEIVGHEKF